MSAPPMVSERDAVLRERAASAKARCAAIHDAICQGDAPSISPRVYEHYGYHTAMNPCGHLEGAALRSANQQQAPEPSRDALGDVLWRFIARVRLHVGSAILGDGWLGMMRYYALLSQRGRDCITPDGQVILANCAPLAELLYAQIPGRWQVTIARQPDAPRDELCPDCGGETLILEDDDAHLSCAWCEWKRPLVEATP